MWDQGDPDVHAGQKKINLIEFAAWLQVFQTRQQPALVRGKFVMLEALECAAEVSLAGR